MIQDVDFFFDCFEKKFPIEKVMGNGVLRITDTSISFRSKKHSVSEKVRRGMCKATFVDKLEKVLEWRDK